MKLTMLGTGNALVTECYNTCFLLEDNGQSLLVDGGGGNTILRQIKYAGYDWRDIHHIFVTHKHTDHLLGIVWMVRMICQYMSRNKYLGETYIYSHKEVIDLLRYIAKSLLLEKDYDFIDKKLHLVEISDGQILDIIGHNFEFFDINSEKTKQFGFVMDIVNGKRLTCCGDEPLTSRVERYATESEWLMHEAFCLHSQADIFHPYEKRHSTVKDACELAERLKVKNLILYHTEDKNIKDRKELYKKEGTEYYNGNLYVPDDLEVIRV